MNETDSPAIQLSVPGEVANGSRVPVSLTVRNTTGKTVDLYLHGREPTLDVIVRGTDGRIVWQRLADQTLRAILKIHPLPAGDSLVLRTDWIPTVAGEFTVTAVVLSESPRLESRPARVIVK